MKVLVTGAAGFIGRNLTPALVAAGHETFALARPDQLDRVAAGEPVGCDLAEPLSDEALPRTDAIVHLAQANVPFPDQAMLLYRVNTVSTAGLLDYGRRTGVSHFMFASSGSVYGFGKGVRRESDALAAPDFYGATKIHAERLVALYGEFFATTTLRFFVPYGPGQTGRLVPALIGRVERGDPVTLNGGGQPHSNPTFVADIVRVITSALERQAHTTVNVAGDEQAGIRELAAHIGGALGREPVFADGSPDGPGDLLADNTLLHELFPRPLTPLAEGIRRTVEARRPVAV